MAHKIKQGGELHVEERDDPVRGYDQIHILDSGWVVGICEASYTADYIPPHRVSAIKTHTSDEQERNFVTKDIPEEDDAQEDIDE